jgi:uncharacterized membrane protein YdbT with pleckstrin-like domain
MSHFIQNNLKQNEKLSSCRSESFKSLFLLVTIYLIFISIWFGYYLILALANNKSISIVFNFFFSTNTFLVIWGLPILLSIKPVITLFTTEYGISNMRIISKNGLIRRNIEEINLSSIESIMVDQSIIGRILNYGTIVISGRGASKVVFKNIDNVVEVRKLIKNK